MIIFGLISSIFDYVTFGVLTPLLKTTPEQFRTGWFVESMLTELFIILVLRTRRSPFRSTPGKLLWITTLVITLITIIIPYLPISQLMGFTPLPLSIMMMMLITLALYLVISEIAKRIYFRQVSY